MREEFNKKPKKSPLFRIIKILFYRLLISLWNSLFFFIYFFGWVVLLSCVCTSTAAAAIVVFVAILSLVLCAKEIEKEFNISFFPSISIIFEMKERKKQHIHKSQINKNHEQKKSQANSLVKVISQGEKRNGTV